MTPANDTLNHTLINALKSLEDGGNPTHIAHTHNYLFDERVAKIRQTDYENAYPSNSSHIRDWRNYHQAYLLNHVQVGRSEPDTFTEKNSDAIVTGLDENQYIVRLENINQALVQSNFTLSELNRQITACQAAETTPDALSWLENFCAQWNDWRDNRPVFAAFHGELRHEIEKSGWANLVRNRLGLSHLDAPTPDLSFPVALMRYRVSDVLTNLDREKTTRSFSVPTVLDGELNAHFFPSPGPLEYGRTLNLLRDSNCDDLVSEILHRRMDYKPEHFYKTGEITTGIPGHPLSELRNEHLWCLRIESDNETFGMEIL